MEVELIAIFFSLLSLYVSVRVAWDTRFKPASLSVVMPHFVFWQFSSYKGQSPTGEVVSRKHTPALCIRNFGAKPEIIEDIRITFKNNGNEVISYPVSVVSIDIIEAPSKNRGNRELGEGAPFLGISLAANEEWKNTYAYSMKVADYEILVGDVEVYVEVRTRNKKKWKSIYSDTYSFGTHPHHLRPLKQEGVMTIGSSNAHVYLKRWRETHG
ncbi:MAG: hypothetical protein AB2745_19560 [Candidatus Thiodiazotropha endolucinida]